MLWPLPGFSTQLRRWGPPGSLASTLMFLLVVMTSMCLQQGYFVHQFKDLLLGGFLLGLPKGGPSLVEAFHM